MTPARRLLAEIVRLGAVPGAPADTAVIAATEVRLAASFPPGMVEFYRIADGTEQPTSSWTWDFFSLSRMVRLSEIRKGCANLRLYDESELIAITSLIVFCDVLIDAPTYAFEADPSSPNYGHFFADQGSEGWRVARSFDEFVDVFVAESDDILLNSH